MADDDDLGRILSRVRASLALEQDDESDEAPSTPPSDPFGGLGLDEALRRGRPPALVRADWQRSWDQRRVGDTEARPRRRESDPWHGVGLAEALRPTARGRKPGTARVVPTGAPPEERQAADDTFGGLSLKDVLRPPRRRPRLDVTPSPPSTPPPPDALDGDDVAAEAEAESTDVWRGAGLADVLVARPQRAPDASAYEPVRRRAPRPDALGDWGGGLGDVLVARRRRPLENVSDFEPVARRRATYDPFGGESLASVLVSRRPVRRPRSRRPPVESRRDESAFERRPVRRPDSRRPPGDDLPRDFMRDDELTYERLLALDVRPPPSSELVAKRRRAAASALAAVAFDKNAHDDVACVVCLEDFNDGETLRQLRCLHIFHRKCIAKWLEHDSRCPTCRRGILLTEPPRPS